MQLRPHDMTENFISLYTIVKLFSNVFEYLDENEGLCFWLLITVTMAILLACCKAYSFVPFLQSIFVQFLLKLKIAIF